MREAVFIKPFRLSRDEIFLCLAAATGMIYALIFPQPAAASASRALRLCGGRVVPALCVFMIFAKILAGSGISEVLSAAERPKRLGVSGGGLLAATIGLISGYPMGAAAAAELCRENKMSRREAGSLLPYINNAGPAFLIGAVGAGMFGEGRVGAIFLAAQTISSVILISFGKKSRKNIVSEKNVSEPKKKNPAGLVASSVAQGGLALVSVCAFVVFFTVISDAVVELLSLCGIENQFVFSAVRGFFEITSGLDSLGTLYAAYPVLSVMLGGAMIGFSGISVMMQVYDRSEVGGIPTRGYFRGKLLMSALTSLISADFYLAFCANDIKISVFAAGVFIIFLCVFIFGKKVLKKCRKTEIYDV